MPPITQQTSTATSAQRNLVLLSAFSDALAAYALDAGKILSFGCSDGYECVDLHKTLPAATIFGCDINENALNNARERCKNIATVFDSSYPQLDLYGPFDGIVALNVLCRYPQCAGYDEISEIYPFELFDEALRLLDAHLCVGGLIAVFNANYFFEGAKVSACYSPVDFQTSFGNGWIEKYDRSGRRVSDLVVNWDGDLYTRSDFFTLIRDRRNAGGDVPVVEELEYFHRPILKSPLPGSTKQVFWRKDK